MAGVEALRANRRSFPSIRPCFIRTFRHPATANATMKPHRPCRHPDRAHMRTAPISLALVVALATGAADGANASAASLMDAKSILKLIFTCGESRAPW